MTTTTRSLPAVRTYEYLTDNEANFLATLVNERFEADDRTNREIWRNRFFAIRTRADIQRFIDDVKLTQTLERQQWARERQAEAERQAAERAQAKQTAPTQDGYYRDPETGTLFRLRYDRKAWGFIVSRYSKTGGARRLVRNTDEIVKGKFTRLSAWDSRMLLNRGGVKAEWLISPETLAQDYAYGFCPLHNGPLTDAVSVILGYGPDCAKREGLPWGEDEAQRVLAARQSNQEV